MDTSLIRSPTVFKLEKIDIGFKRLTGAIYPQFLDAKFPLHTFSSSCVFMAPAHTLVKGQLQQKISII